MASIPNLMSLGRGRGRGRGGSETNTPSRLDRDSIIRNTDNDAATSRISAVEAGYLQDPFAKYLTGPNWQPRLPLMNRGTYVRTAGIDRIVDTFLTSTTGLRQIISLGAGSDTRFFRLRQRGFTNFSYHELDFKENNKTKILRLKDPQSVQTIKSISTFDINDTEILDDELHSKDYCIHAIDLRELPSKLDWINAELPTLLISECCLAYLSPDHADNVLAFFVNAVTSAPTTVIIYEPIRPYDPFGQTMLRNLMTRGIELRTIEKYSDLPSQRQRLANLDFRVHAADIEHIWKQWIKQEEKDRIDKLEWMDEVEEFLLLAKHYCISWGWRNYDDQNSWLALSEST